MFGTSDEILALVFEILLLLPNFLVIVQTKILFLYYRKPMGAILEYPATYLHVPERFTERSIWKQKDPFLFNEMQISGRVF